MQGVLKETSPHKRAKHYLKKKDTPTRAQKNQDSRTAFPKVGYSDGARQKLQAKEQTKPFVERVPFMVASEKAMLPPQLHMLREVFFLKFK